MTDIIIFLCKFVLHSLFLHVNFLNIHIIMIYKCCSFLFYMSTRRMEINSAALNLELNYIFTLECLQLIVGALSISIDYIYISFHTD